jgi:hypothetical protein
MSGWWHFSGNLAILLINVGFFGQLVQPVAKRGQAKSRAAQILCCLERDHRTRPDRDRVEG